MQKNNDDNKFKNKNIYEAFNTAIAGLIYSFKTQRNMRIQYVMAIIVLVLVMLLPIEKLELLIIISAISLVLITELINTAVEKTVDLYCDMYHPLAKVAKDVAAGAVVIACLNSMMVGFLVFKDKLGAITQNVITTVIEEKSYYSLLVLVLISVIVVVLKAIINKGTPLEGGMPSGHVSLAFGIVTLIAIYSNSVFIFALSLVLALLIAQSRYQSKIHTVSEVFYGAFLGTIVVLLTYYLINLKGV